jgi:hypothetical protein
MINPQSTVPTQGCYRYTALSASFHRFILTLNRRHVRYMEPPFLQPLLNYVRNRTIIESFRVGATVEVPTEGWEKVSAEMQGQNNLIVASTGVILFLPGRVAARREENQKWLLSHSGLETSHKCKVGHNYQAAVTNRTKRLVPLNLPSTPWEVKHKKGPRNKLTVWLRLYCCDPMIESKRDYSR